MIQITKYESEAIKKRFPSAHIVRTMKQKSKRHHYYCEEAKRVVQFINQLRATGTGVYTNTKVNYK